MSSVAGISYSILLSQQILDAIKCVVDDNFVFQQQCTSAFNTVQPLQYKTLNFLSPELWPVTVQSLIPLRDLGSHTAA